MSDSIVWWSSLFYAWLFLLYNNMMIYIQVYIRFASGLWSYHKVRRRMRWWMGYMWWQWFQTWQTMLGVFFWVCSLTTNDVWFTIYTIINVCEWTQCLWCQYDIYEFYGHHHILVDLISNYMCIPCLNRRVDVLRPKMQTLSGYFGKGCRSLINASYNSKIWWVNEN